MIYKLYKNITVFDPSSSYPYYLVEKFVGFQIKSHSAKSLVSFSNTYIQFVIYSKDSVIKCELLPGKTKNFINNYIFN